MKTVIIEWYKNNRQTTAATHSDPNIWTLASQDGRGVGGFGYVIFKNSGGVFHGVGFNQLSTYTTISR